MVSPVSSADFDKVAAEIGETVGLITPTLGYNTDSGSVSTNSESTSNVTAVVLPGKEGKRLAPMGIVNAGSIFLAFKAASAPAVDQQLTVNSRRYRIVALEEYRVKGSIHHYEAYAELNR